MVYFYLIILIHYIIAAYAYYVFSPDKDTKNKSIYKIKKEREYSELFKKNFPFLSKYSVVLLHGPFFYYPFYFEFSKIDFVAKASYHLKPIAYILISSLFIMLILIRIVYREYKERDRIIRQKHPFIINVIFLFLYNISFVLGATFVHICDYTFDFSTGEEHIVTITNLESNISRSTTSKSYYYKIHFEPSVGGHSKLELPRSLYYKLKKDDKIKLYVKKGFFDIPYISSRKILLKT